MTRTVNALQRIKSEVISVFPVFLYFFVMFQLLALTQLLILRTYDIEIASFFTAFIMAGVVAKVVMVLDLLPFINRFPDKPLMYNVAWKTVLYFVAAFLVRYLEQLVSFAIEYGNVIEAHGRLLAEVVWPHFLLVQIWLLVVFFLYSVLSELIRSLGRERVQAMFFGSK